MSPRTAPSDKYEAEVVGGEGAVIARDKVVSRKAFWMMAPMALIALVATIAIAGGAEPATGPWGALLPGAWFAWTVWMMLTKLSIRSVLTTRELQVHWGLRRWKVPLEAITKCEPVAPLAKGMPTAVMAVNAWAPKGHVLVVWNDAGEEERVQFPCDDPTGFSMRINAAREVSPARIEDVADAAAEEELALEESAREAER